MKAGKVILVGAGPGAVDLLTLRAVRTIAQADVLVYDRLIQQDVLALAGESVERIYMGKDAGHSPLQSAIQETLVAKAKEGKVVVRLKGGDPFLFGRGGEEIEYLAEHGVPFEVVPGVSACLSAPLSANIAVTHRDYSSSVVIVTGHNAAGNEDRIDWNAVARIDTAVFLMCVHNVGTIADLLMEAGRPAETPAALIQKAYWESGNVVVGTLGSIAIDALEQQVKPPATLVVGDVVRLRSKLEQIVALNMDGKEEVRA
jgi:uroporphyrinogen III methyltransferase/synthase